MTRSFLKSTQGNKRLVQTTVCRVYVSVRHFARWAHRTLNPFPFGCPTDGVSPPEEPDDDWKGLTRQYVKTDQQTLAQAIDALT